MRIKAMIGIPTMSNRMTVQLAGLIESLRYAACAGESNFDLAVCYKHGFSPVEYARNAIVGDFLRSDCTHLWFIDEDMLPGESATRLLFSPFDVVCAQMYKFDHSNEVKGTTVGLGMCAMRRISNGLYQPIMPVPGQPALQEVDAVGTGCTVIARHVLEDRRMWFDNVYETVTGEVVDGNVDTGQDDYAPAIFRYLRAPSGLNIMGEDVDFSRRAKDLGYKVGVDLMARCGHYKTINIDEAGNLATEVVQRVVRGIKTDDGRVFKFGIEPAKKAEQSPPADKMVRSSDFERRAM